MKQREAAPDFAGQLLFWNKGPQRALERGRVGIQVFGTLSTPEALAQQWFADEYLKYDIVGRSMNHAGFSLQAFAGLTERVQEPWCSQGYDISQLMTAPIWRAR